MIAEQAKLAALLEGAKQFEVPLYQRPYSWGGPEREQFWRDILRTGREPGSSMHFTGSVVFMERHGSMSGNLKRARLIDGQQRLTTLTLLMLAVAERLDQEGELEVPLEGTTDTQQIGAGDVRTDYLFNRRLTGDSRFKLLPTHADRATLKALVEKQPLPDRPSKAVMEGAAFFREKLADPALDLREVLRGVHKLQVVTVALEEGHDDPQLIFESLNSTGKDLTQADLIRNNVLMGLRPEEQDELSREYWVPMEALFAETEEGTFDRFMRDFLTLRTRTLPNEREVYAAFKAYRQARPTGEPVKALVMDVAHLARLYLRIIDPAQVPQADVQLAMRDLTALRVRVISPFLLELLEDHEQGLLSSKDLLGALRLTESFLLRRAVVGERTSPLNRFFAGVGRDLKKDEYLRSLERALVRFQDRDQDGFPSDEVFARALQSVALYKLNVCKPLLVRLERSHNPKEKFESAGLTIEHVLPQNEDLSDAWRDMLGANWEDIQGRLVHTLGNLTLTGYNSELGDRPFEEKKSLPEPKGYAHSRLLMTRHIAATLAWTEDRIESRAAALTEQALKLWPFPAFTPDELATLRTEGRQRSKVKTVEDHLETSGAALRALFTQVRDRLLKLDAEVTEAPQKHYVAYKLQGANFCDMVPQPSLNTVKGWLNLPPEELDDPQHLTRDISGKGKPGNGNVEFVLPLQADLEAFEALARQALEYQRGRATGEVPKGAGGSPAEAELAALPDAQQEVRAALEARLQELPGVERITNKFHISYKDRQVFLELRARKAALHLSVKGLAGAPQGDAAEAWESKGIWWTRKIRTLQELDEAWPALLEAFEGQGLAPGDSEEVAPPEEIRQVQEHLIDTVTALGSDTSAKTAGRTTVLMSGGQEFARLRKNESRGFVSVEGTLADGQPQKLYVRTLGTLDQGTALLKALYEVARA